MSAFTTPSPATQWQALSFLNPILTSLREHQSALSQSLTSLVVAGQNIQGYTLWSGIQTWLQTYCASYVDHSQTVTGAASLPMFTLATWRSLAGMHPSGFRRVPGASPPASWTNLSDSAYSYGLIQPGDMFGPWLFDDLQRGLDILRWVPLPVTWSTASLTYNENEGSQDEDEEDPEQQRAQAEADFDSLDNKALNADAPRAYTMIWYPGWDNTHIRRRCAHIQCTVPTSPSPFRVDFYVLPTGYGAGFDAQGDSLTADVLNLINIEVSPTPGTLLSDQIGAGYDVRPPNWHPSYTHGYYGYQVAASYAILKPIWSYSR